MNWLVFAASLAALLALGGVAWRLRGGGADSGLTSPEAAVLLAGEALPGFPAETALVGEDRRAALMLGRGARVAVLVAHRARIVAREIRWSDVRAVHGGIRVDNNERRFGAVTIAGVDALDVRRAGGDAMSLPKREALS